MTVQGEILSNQNLQDDYYKVEFYAPEICAKAQAGQFVHVQIAHLRDRILRRPFSICDVDNQGRLTVVYKAVGIGTENLAKLPAGTVCDLMGPLGKPFTQAKADELPVIVAGGYGSAATYQLSKLAPKGLLLLGARSKKDLILTENFAQNGYEVLTSTEDGSHGEKGLVTKLLEQVISEHKDKKLHFYACGPTGMLMAMGKLLLAEGLDGELSLDHLMCCGVGACFACVVKVKADNEDGWRYARTCKEGPVFMASEVYYG
jgi:dihydroorotate dehydrogenase electron transfer subunit